jgi:excisionase family DNA binding protein
MKDKVMTTKQAAEYLAMSHKTLEDWRRKGEGPRFIKVGSRSVRYRQSELDAWITEATFVHTGEYTSR